MSWLRAYLAIWLGLIAWMAIAILVLLPAIFGSFLYIVFDESNIVRILGFIGLVIYAPIWLTFLGFFAFPTLLELVRTSGFFGQHLARLNILDGARIVGRNASELPAQLASLFTCWLPLKESETHQMSAKND